jgi:hypothetical protein
MLTHTDSSPSSFIRHRHAILSHDNDIITTYHAMSREIATSHDIITPYHVLCAANAVFLTHAFTPMFSFPAYEASRSSPWDFGLDRPGAVPILRFSMTPPNWSGVDDGLFGQVRRFPQNL